MIETTGGSGTAAYLSRLKCATDEWRTPQEFQTCWSVTSSPRGLTAIDFPLSVTRGVPLRADDDVFQKTRILFHEKKREIFPLLLKSLRPFQLQRLGHKIWNCKEQRKNG